MTWNGLSPSCSRTAISPQFKDQYSGRFHQLFAELIEKARTCNNVATLQNIKVEADALKVRLLNEISRKDEQIAQDKIREENEKYRLSGVSHPRPVVTQPKVMKRKNISIKSVNLSASWQIETAQDVDRHIAALRERILRELDDDTILNLEF
jgi:hypothetical protein